MEAVARTKNVRVSPRKVRLVADVLRGMQVQRAMQLLATTQKRGSSVLSKTLKSAIANALQKGNVTEEELYIVRLEVDGGSTLRRMHIGSRSHVRMYTKRSSHIRVVVGDKKNEVKEVTKREEIKEEVKEAKPMVKKESKKAIKKEETK